MRFPRFWFVTRICFFFYRFMSFEHRYTTVAFIYSSSKQVIKYIQYCNITIDENTTIDANLKCIMHLEPPDLYISMATFQNFKHFYSQTIYIRHQHRKSYSFNMVELNLINTVLLTW